MKAIMVMFDSLNRRFLPPYGCDWIHAPNFQRLSEKAVTFDNCYAGSMPCMPARRELQTGRYNFLHRSWGPLEPFDDSVPEMLRKAGVYTHMITDHQHYWEDGGSTYHNRFDTYEFFRGQEGDRWKGRVPAPGETLATDHHAALHRQDRINRQYLENEADHPQTRVFDAGIEFVRTNADRDRWLVQIETFDPHEPFFSYDRHKAHYARPYDGPQLDWPTYGRVTETAETVQHVRDQYSALLSMCDASLGRVIDMMDELDLWDDTMLIVCTDHGFLLGEHGWWAKMVQPWYDENIHTPLFIWDPRAKAKGQRRKSLVQTIDFGPTLLDYFGVAPTERMEGHALGQTVASDTPVREAGLFGAFGMHVNVTDGRYVYMRAPRDASNRPLDEHTLMPTHMRWQFTREELKRAELIEGFPFTQDVPVLRIPGMPFGAGNAFELGTLLFDLETDPGQEHPLEDPQIELRMINLMLELMRANEAPESQYQRMGLPAHGPADLTHTRLGRAPPAEVPWPSGEGRQLAGQK
ncbi:sulfatase [Devosia nitrariae]|uniref:Sulfatase n=1 Tax=Devosia nitrariae TaxID=2071872 RepID=A0ABQ5W710_9HYPH|nr:sulfatase [Devosia nitrariae]GLQ55862.1 sulfatase [Devosia nitrariae]